MLYCIGVYRYSVQLATCVVGTRGKQPYCQHVRTSLCSVGQTTSSDDIFSITSFSDLNVVLGFPATLTCAASVVVNGAQVTYSITKDGSPESYLATQL